MDTQKKVADAEYERIKAMAEEARTYLSFARVTAPISGRITEKRIDAGSMVSPGMPLLVIEGGGSSYIEASIDAGLGAKIKTGMVVEAIVETMDRPLQGTIREVFLPLILYPGLLRSRWKSGMQVSEADCLPVCRFPSVKERRSWCLNRLLFKKDS